MTLPHLAFVPAPRRRPPTEVGTSPDPTSRDAGELFAVRVLDNDRNSYEQVMAVVMATLGLALEEAYAVAWTIDHRGSCVVAEAPHDEAEAIAGAIRTIGIEVVLEPLPGPRDSGSGTADGVS